MKVTKYLGDKPFWNVALKLAIPIALQNVLSSSFMLVDTMMVSRLGDLTLSAVGMAGQWGWLFNLLCFGLCSGMSVFVSQYWGVRDMNGIRRVYGMALTTAMVACCLFLGIALGAPEAVLRMFNQDPNVVETGCRYLTIICFTYPAVTLTLIMGMVLRGTEQVKIPVYVSVVTTVANIILDYGMIFGKLGFPAMGVEGAAWASVIASWLGPVMMLLFSMRAKNLLISPLNQIFHFGFHDLGVFYKKAAPVMANEGMWAMGMLVLNMIYSNMGYEYYAGLTVFKTFSELSFAFYCGLCNACVIMVGKSVGMGKIKRALEDAVRFTVLVPMTALLLGVVTILLRYPLISLFATGDNLSAVTLQTALAITVFCSLEGIFRNIPYVQIVGVFRSGGETMRGMLFDLSALWCVSIPAAWLCANVFHLPFVLVVAAAYLGEDVPKAAMCLHYFKSKKWLKPVTKEGQEGLRLYWEEHGKA